MLSKIGFWSGYHRVKSLSISFIQIKNVGSIGGGWVMYISEISKTFFPSYRIKLPITSSAKEGSSHCIRAWRQAWFIHSSLSHQFSSLFLSLFRHRENSHSSFPFIAICVALCKYNIHFLFSYITLGTSILGHIHIFPSSFSLLYRCQMSCQIASIALCDSCEVSLFLQFLICAYKLDEHFSLSLYVKFF